VGLGGIRPSTPATPQIVEISKAFQCSAQLQKHHSREFSATEAETQIESSAPMLNPDAVSYQFILHDSS
jgi:hypothetical protein